MKHWLVVCSVSCLLWTCCASQGGCEEPPDIDFGEIVSDEKVGYQEHDRIQYRCNPGFALEGSEWISCNGQRWTPPPKCLASCSITRQQLDTKNLLLSSGRRRSQLVRSNQTLEFKCREGYVITTPSVRKCVDGRMDLPSCISERGKNCSRSPTIENGDIITLSQKEYASGSWVEFKCQQYYAMEGESRSFCNNGTWTKVPACLEPCVIALSESQQIVVKGSSYDSGFQTMYLQRGDSVELSCKPGYVLEANPSQSTFLIQCNEEPIVYPKCKEITCNPPQVTNGTFRPRRKMYQGGDLIQIECNREVQLENGQNIAECTSSGWSPSPQCGGKKPCDFPIVKNGALSYSYQSYRDSYFPKKVGETVDYRCNDGFLPINKEYWHRSTCREFGWDPEPKCFKKCAPPPSLPHGRFIYSYWAIFIEENEISFSCDEGYYPASPEAKIKCTKDGWAPTPRCAEIVTCTIVHLPNGYFQQRKRNFALRETTTYGCQSGYTTPEGLERGETQCLEDGWTPKPECIQTCPKPPEGNMIFINATKSVFLFMEKLHYECKDGYETINQATGDHTVCTKKGWSPKPGCQPQCEPPPRRDYEELSDQSNKEAYSHGDTVIYNCRPGYIKLGRIRYRCNNGNWEQVPPFVECRQKPCGHPGDIQFGSFELHNQQEFVFGARVVYRCDDGYQMLSQTDYRDCRVDGWSNDVPHCEDATCPPPPSVSHGQLIGQPKERYLPFEKVRYRCDQGWSLFGPQSVTCSNKQWTELPTCTNAGGMCGRPPVIENGDIRETAVAQYKPNSIVNYQCVSFYIMRGSPAVQCIFGHWTQAPTCIAACTATEEAMLSHKIQLKWFPAEKLYSQSGDEMEFVCRPGFHPAPSSPPFRVRCVEGYIEYPTCITGCTATEEAMLSHKIQLKWFPAKKLYLQSGDLVEFVCRRGFHPAPSSPPFRVQCVEGHIKYPTCISTNG